MWVTSLLNQWEKGNLWLSIKSSYRRLSLAWYFYSGLLWCNLCYVYICWGWTPQRRDLSARPCRTLSSDAQLVWNLWITLASSNAESMDVHLTTSLSIVMYSYSWLEFLCFPLETDIIMLGYAPFWRISFTTVGRFEQCLCPGCVVEWSPRWQDLVTTPREGLDRNARCLD